MIKIGIEDLNQLNKQLQGTLLFDDLIKAIYATDASVYRILPTAVAYPKNSEDIIRLIQFANQHSISLIPRTAGTSLAGQCVGNGIIVDASKHFNQILNLDTQNKTVTVQPGVVRDELNNYLKPFGLFFGPNTSTSNRCMIGGMVGNNSSGTTSIQYGVTRDTVLKLKTILSDGSDVAFKALSKKEFDVKLQLDTLEGKIYRKIYNQLKSSLVQEQIKNNFPKPEIHRRNTGYAIDELIKSEVFTTSSIPFNMCKLLSGSEGTLAFTTEITLQLQNLPPNKNAMIACHFNSVEDCLNTVETVMTHNLHTCEMMDKTILDLTKHNKTQQKNRQFVQGDPKAILMCELKSDTDVDLNKQIDGLLHSLTKEKSYANVVLKDGDIVKAMELRKAGLGLLGNMIGDKKSVACIEDTAVALPDLASYIKAFTQIMTNYQQKAVYYAHAGAGELHLRPILNLKDSHDVSLFRKITTDVAKLVKKHQGSMSGEHGDGIVRAEFIPMMIGEENYTIIKEVKSVFDPNAIFNRGKIVDALPMDENLRYIPDREEPKIETAIDFSASKGILREAEKCNGSGDCRKLPEFGGSMCPSYRATKNEKDTTRARANALREFLTHSNKKNKFNHHELKEVFDLCLSCKACASECPSSVDVASLKAEFQYQYQKANGASLRDKLFAYNNKFNKIASYTPKLTNAIFSNKITSGFVKKLMGISPQRTLPLISTKRLPNKTKHSINQEFKKHVYLFVDEFTNHLDTQIGLDTLELLSKLNYKVTMVKHEESGRSFISKGFLDQAKKIANKNVSIFKNLITEKTPLIGIEPSAIYTFKDDYPKLANDKNNATKIAKHTYLIEEFLNREIQQGHIVSSQFSEDNKTIKIHAHCYQKALGSSSDTFHILNLPKNYNVTVIPSGCCGMAGSFGYEKEHYAISMQIGNQTLFPNIKNTNHDVIISANGTSCRHQILDGTARQALHPVTILNQALI
ncbi:FAD-binding and (Fe-S)-binding domain-containing protein [Mangrovimonas spongiae]|uniref:FAD-binding oxidoreductase n=1 Tax=Mangrovimonas spongiae TaxID=2494697 RepID=A0A428JX33_9FLAO|nr:FAD-binding and (Fe-S)-binding domain-containing protein [Mangrovimonas spongiae]RSK38644.1 FAD-binding oxidoreductase [Mangrovimonas spongiae]